MENSYYSKYLKYKNKYLSLKSEKIIVGGSSAAPALPKKEPGEVIKGTDGNFYSPLDTGSGKKFLKQIAGPSSIGIRPNLADPTKPGKVVIKLCKYGVTDSTSTADPQPDYYKYLENKFEYKGPEEDKMTALSDTFNKPDDGLIAKGNATPEDWELVKDIIAKQNHEDFGSEDDEAGMKATDEFNALELCSKNRTPQEL
tara:strand:- start:1508 stop:2104 length:597 start_codon:yes stop_codon:yes gene_type:complete